MANKAGPFSEPEPTTAQMLGAYRRELEVEGIPHESIGILVIEAARQLLRDDPPLRVGVEIPKGMTLLRVSIPVDAALVQDRQAVEIVASEAALRAVEEVLAR